MTKPDWEILGLVAASIVVAAGIGDWCVHSIVKIIHAIKGTDVEPKEKDRPGDGSGLK